MQKVMLNKNAPMGLKFPADPAAVKDGKAVAVDLTLQPGENMVDEKVWAAAKAHKMVQVHLADGHIDDGSGPKKAAAPAKPAAKKDDEEKDEDTNPGRQAPVVPPKK